MFRTSRVGIITPDGKMFKWSDVGVELKIEALITLPEGITFPMRSEWEGNDARELLLELLDATCEPGGTAH